MVLTKIIRLSVLFICLPIFAVRAQTGLVQYFDLNQVRLLQSPFFDAQNMDKKYMLEMDVDRLLAPYMKEAELDWPHASYGNWENTGLDGHIGGHYLSALFMMFASTGDQEIKSRLDYMLDQLKLAQEKNRNGYLGGVPKGQRIWEELRAGKIDAGNFSLNQGWVPLYNIHKTYAGLRDAYLITGNGQAKDMLIKLTDWFYDLTSDYSEAQFQEILISEHGGLNEIFADVADITGDSKYLDLAKKMSHGMILEPLAQNQDKLTGMHANTQIPKVIGFQRIAQLATENKWNQSAIFFWENVTGKRSVSVGGNSVREHFHPSNDFSSMISSVQGPETCNSYNMMRLSEKLFESGPDRKYIDYYERALYNHILSSQHPTKGGFVYFTPMRPQHYRVYSQPHENFWCCVGSGLENHAKYGQVIYSKNGDELYLNLFIPSELNWEEKGIKLKQQTDFPYSESTSLSLENIGKENFILKIRHPKWVKAGKLKIEINGKDFPVTISKDGYVTIHRKWKSKDQVYISLPMETQIEYFADASPWASFVYGPIVLASKTGTEDMSGIFADDSRMGHIASGKMIPLEQTDILLKEKLQTLPVKVSGEDLKFLIPENSVYNQTKEIELIPFYHIHESRYQIYWPVLSEEEIMAFKNDIRTKDELMLKIEALTVDQVALGEQQPETDHNFIGKQSKTGQEHGVFWRNTTDWFSYELKNPDGLAKTLRITYTLEKSGGNPFMILINGELLAKEHFSTDESKKIIERDYDLADFQGSTLELKFESIDEKETEKIQYIRLLKSED